MTEEKPMTEQENHDFPSRHYDAVGESILRRLTTLTKRYANPLSVVESNFLNDELNYLEYLLMVADMHYYRHWRNLKSSMEFDPNGE